VAVVSNRHASALFNPVQWLASSVRLLSDDSMKRLLGFWLAVLIPLASAFDPDRVGPPPKSRTVEETRQFASHFTRPFIDFDQEPLEAALWFVACPELPVAYRVRLDATALPNWQKKKVTLQLRGATMLQVLEAMAKQLNADVKIGENVISLVPRKAQK
jgi:hypothetical protein